MIPPDARCSRRRLLIGSAALSSSRLALAAEGPRQSVVDLELQSEDPIARRCRLLVPRAAPRQAPVPLLVLLHGLGETTNDRAGIRAWSEAYGLANAYERLTHAPLIHQGERFVSADEVTGLNDSIASRPFEGLVIACPFMPSPGAVGGSAKMLPRYARWLETTLLPRIRAEVGIVSAQREQTAIAGVSLGGYVAMEVFLRRPELFGIVGTVQGAYGPGPAAQYAKRVAALNPAAAPLGVYVATSSLDPYRRANEQLGRALRDSGVPTRLSVRRGPHNQPWLREIGCLELLLWHDRALRGQIEPGEISIR